MGVQHVQHVGVQDVQCVHCVQHVQYVGVHHVQSYGVYSMPARPLLVLGPGVQPSVSPQTPAGEQSTGRAERLEEGRNITVLCFFFFS